jgi:hypothetical protein
MDEEIRRLRTDARRLAQGKARSQVRYPEAFRRAAVTLARMRQGRGGSVTRLAREIGVSEPTLTKWLRPSPLPGLRPVAVALAAPPEPHAGSSPVLITPNGVRVEGLDRAALVAVLRALA